MVRWLGWYRDGGLTSVLERTPGHAAVGAASRLSEQQKWLLVEESAKGTFRTYDEAREWTHKQYGVAYRYKGMHSLLTRLGGAAEGAPTGVGEGGRRGPGGVKKGGPTGALWGAGLHHGDEVHLADELRVGLRSQVRRVLAPRGVKVTQTLQLRYEWEYLLLAVDPLSGSIRWEWIERMKQEHIRGVLQDWDLDCVVWDGAGAHRGKVRSAFP